MKKYMPVLFVVTLLITLLGFNVSSVSARNGSDDDDSAEIEDSHNDSSDDVEDSDEGNSDDSNSECRTGDRFNRMTGKPCHGGATSECKSGDRFSSITGRPCGDIIDDGGIVDNGGISRSCRAIFKKEFKIGSRGDDVKELQQTLKEEGLFSGKVDGVYGQITNGAKVGHYKKCLNPIISGVSGPQTLNTSQQGVWTVKASSSTGGNLSYSVVWGDESYLYPQGQTSMRPFQQSATFEHSYSQAGIYTPKFIVKNEKGQSAQTSLSVRVGKVSSSSSVTVLSPNGGESYKVGDTVNVKFDSTYNLVSLYLMKSTENDISKSRKISGDIHDTGSYLWTIGSNIAPGNYRIGITNSEGSDKSFDSSDSYFTITSKTTNTPSVAVLSPNGGETWEKRETKTIKWKNNFVIPTCPSGAQCSPAVPKYYDIKLVKSSSSYKVAESVYGSSYEWEVGKVIGTETGLVEDGSYKIQICETGTDTCDLSNSSFKISS